MKRALERGLSVAEVYELTAIDPWFLAQMGELVEAEREYAALDAVDADELRRMKRLGFSDRQLGALRGETEAAVRARRWALGVRPAYKMVDTCAGEFPSATPYLYGSYDEESEAPRTGKQVGRHPRQRTESHRAGRRVRLLLRARRDGAARAGIRDDHDQLESRDGLDGLRYVGQAVLRAADARGRARDRRARAAGWA